MALTNIRETVSTALQDLTGLKPTVCNAIAEELDARLLLADSYPKPDRTTGKWFPKTMSPGNVDIHNGKVRMNCGTTGTFNGEPTRGDNTLTGTWTGSAMEAYDLGQTLKVAAIHLQMDNMFSDGDK